MTSLPDFAARLRQAMDAQGLSGRGLARALPADESKVCRWLRGRNWPRVPNLAALARELHVSTDWLLGLKPGRYGPDPAPRDPGDGLLP